MDIQTKVTASITILVGLICLAMLTVVLANTYGCDGRLASNLVYATAVVSVVSVVTVFSVLT